MGSIFGAPIFGSYLASEFVCGLFVSEVQRTNLSASVSKAYDTSWVNPPTQKNSDYKGQWYSTRALLFSYYITITGWGPPKTAPASHTSCNLASWMLRQKWKVEGWVVVKEFLMAIKGKPYHLL